MGESQDGARRNGPCMQAVSKGFLSRQIHLPTPDTRNTSTSNANIVTYYISANAMAEPLHEPMYDLV